MDDFGTNVLLFPIYSVILHAKKEKRIIVCWNYQN